MVAQVVIIVADKDVEDHAGKQLFGVVANQAGVGMVAHSLGQIGIALEA